MTKKKPQAIMQLSLQLKIIQIKNGEPNQHKFEIKLGHKVTKKDHAIILPILCMHKILRHIAKSACCSSRCWLVVPSFHSCFGFPILFFVGWYVIGCSVFVQVSFFACSRAHYFERVTVPRRQ